jgi:hypothetical protein
VPLFRDPGYVDGAVGHVDFEAFSGVKSYVTQDPKTGKHSTHDVGGSNPWWPYYNAMPAISDSNVITVTFGYGSIGSGIISACAVFAVFVLGKLPLEIGFPIIPSPGFVPLEGENKMSHIGRGVKLEQAKICILYDPKDGRIVHTHEVVTFPGGRKVNDEEVKARAFKNATVSGKRTSKLKALHVSPEDFDRTSTYTVDLKSLALIKHERQRSMGFGMKPKAPIIKRTSNKTATVRTRTSRKTKTKR